MEPKFIRQNDKETGLVSLLCTCLVSLETGQSTFPQTRYVFITNGKNVVTV